MNSATGRPSAVPVIEAAPLYRAAGADVRVMRRLLQRAVVYLAGSSVWSATTFLVSLLVAWFLGRDGLGIYTIAMLVAALGSLAADAGLDSLVLRECLMEKPGRMDLVRSALRAKLSTALLAALPAGIIALLATSAVMPSLLAALLIVPRSLSSSLESSLKAALNHKTLFRITWTIALMVLVVAGAVLAAGGSITLLFGAVLLVESVRYLLLSRSAGIGVNPGLPASWRRAMPLVHASYPFALYGIASFLIERMDLFFLGAFRGTAEAGIYAAADRFLLAGNLLAFAVYGSALPAFSGLERSRRYRETWKTSLLLLLLGTGGAVVLYLLAPLLLRATFRFEESVSVLRILALSIPPMIANSLLASSLLASHAEKVLARIFLYILAGAVLLNLLVIPAFGANGAAILAVSLEYGVMLAYCIQLWRLRQ